MKKAKAAKPVELPVAVEEPFDFNVKPRWYFDGENAVRYMLKIEDDGAFLAELNRISLLPTARDWSQTMHRTTDSADFIARYRKASGRVHLFMTTSIPAPDAEEPQPLTNAQLQTLSNVELELMRKRTEHMVGGGSWDREVTKYLRTLLAHVFQLRGIVPK